MNSLPDDYSPAFDAGQTRLLEIWDRLQRIQTDFCLPQELSTYFTSEPWLQALKVLDLGTGNGYYLHQLATHFPGRQYIGVDRSSDLIDSAKRERSNAEVRFTCCDVMETKGEFDYVIMRLLLQHMQDVPAALHHAATLVRPGGAAMIVDAWDPFRCYVPQLPEFMEFFCAYAENERQHGRDRRFSDRIEDLIASRGDWQIVRTTRLLIPSTVSRNFQLFVETYMLLIELVEIVGEMSFDFDRVRRAFEEWALHPHAYTQVGLSMIELQAI